MHKSASWVFDAGPIVAACSSGVARACLCVCRQAAAADTPRYARAHTDTRRRREKWRGGEEEISVCRKLRLYEELSLKFKFFYFLNSFLRYKFPMKCIICNDAKDITSPR